jgi:hypothetical protein
MRKEGIQAMMNEKLHASVLERSLDNILAGVGWYAFHTDEKGVLNAIQVDGTVTCEQWEAVAKLLRERTDA